jgi:hypothetical protein
VSTQRDTESAIDERVSAHPATPRWHSRPLVADLRTGVAPETPGGGAQMASTTRSALSCVEGIDPDDLVNRGTRRGFLLSFILAPPCHVASPAVPCRTRSAIRRGPVRPRLTGSSTGASRGESGVRHPHHARRCARHDRTYGVGTLFNFPA